jgi:hypothetical protein
LLGAFATLGAALAAWRYLAATHQLRKDSHRPAVVMQIVAASREWGFSQVFVKYWNVGSGPAINVELRLNVAATISDPSLPQAEPMKYIGLPPHQDEPHPEPMHLPIGVSDLPVGVHRLESTSLPSDMLPDGARAELVARYQDVLGDRWITRQTLIWHQADRWIEPGDASIGRD